MDESLSFESFFKGARKSAHKAMDEHGRADYGEFALQAGVAVEKLGKAVLVSKNPTYLTEIRNPDMLLYFGGDLELPMDKVRTVGAKDTITRLRRLGVLQADAKLDLLTEMRNGAAHASSGGDEAKEMVSPFARTIETLLNDLGKPLDEFWERWTDAVKNAVNEQEDQIFRDVQLRITQARHAFEDRFVGLPAEVREGALKAPQPRKEEWFAHPMEVVKDGEIVLKASGGDCPACGGQGILTFEPAGRTATGMTFITNGFGCYLCNFGAHGPEEMAALRKANTPLTMTGVTELAVVKSRTLTPAEVAVLKAKSA